MTTLAQNLENPRKPGDLIKIQAAAVAWYRGGAAMIINGTGYARPLNIATAGANFIGVFENDGNNASGTPGTIVNGAPNSGYQSWAKVARTGLFPFNVTQTTITQATVGKLVYFSDDNTITSVVTAVPAGVLVTVDEAGVGWVDIAVGGAFAMPTLGAAAVTAVGTTAADAAALTANAINYCTTAGTDNAQGVLLPVATAGMEVAVKNGSGYIIKVWPQTNAYINAIASHAHLPQATLKSAIYIAYSTTQWYTVPLLPS